MILYSLNAEPRPLASGLFLHGTPGPSRDDDMPDTRKPPQRGGLNEEVGDLEEGDDEQALPGRAGGGLAGG
ncbi:hypothetical protein [Xanthomonas maliensis]|uniref:hypothetical protein n=1 Tax=Xanthomonas maliensis TaxID=1321368 RepID=UPI0003A93C5F|nr:hypothetical protein [Xanthomonas maliensis]KAB7772566.1 hypothetical protein CKY51_00180 [Xanthomonas maliensis]